MWLDPVRVTKYIKKAKNVMLAAMKVNASGVQMGDKGSFRIHRDRSDLHTCQGQTHNGQMEKQLIIFLIIPSKANNPLF